MNVEELRQQLPDYAKDLKLNLSRVLSEEGSPGLSGEQIWSNALACALASRNQELVAAIEHDAIEHASEEALDAARKASALMGMNNVYYRFLHLVGDDSYAQLPVGLRMQAMARPGVDKLDFELLSLAVSAVHGCGNCIKGHEQQLKAGGVDKQAIQSAVRIAAVIHGVAIVLDHVLESTSV